MSKIFARLFVALPVILVTGLMAESTLQAGQHCPALETVQWWDETDHQKMTTYVNSRHDGDWDAYVARWQAHLTSIRAIYKRGGAVKSKKLDMRIEGEKLHAYIMAVKQRLTVTQCLADMELAREAKRLEDMETASGGEDDRLPETVR